MCLSALKSISNSNIEVIEDVLSVLYGDISYIYISRLGEGISMCSMCFSKIRVIK